MKIGNTPLKVVLFAITVTTSAVWAQSKTYTNGENNGATVDATGDITLTVNNADSATQSGIISGTGSATKHGDGTLTLTATNDYSGGTTVSAGTLRLGDGTTNGFISGDIDNNATLSFNHNGDYTYGGLISGSGDLIHDGYILRLSQAQTYTGNTFIKSGGFLVLSTSVDQGLSASTVVDIESGGTLDLSNRVTTLSGLTGSGTVYSFISSGDPSTGQLTLDITSGQTSTFAGTLGGVYPDFSLVKTGVGTQVLTGTNTYTGGTTVNAGTLSVSSDASLGDSSGALTVTSGATLATGGDFRSNRSITLDGTGTELTNNGELIIGNNGTGSLSLTNDAAASTYNLTLAYTGGNGTLDISSGSTVNVGNSTHLGTASSTVNLNTGGTLATAALSGSGTFNLAGGTLRSNAGFTSSIDAVLSNASNIDTNGFDTTLSGILSGSGSLTKTGTGTLTLSGANTYNGDTTVSNGTLALGDTYALQNSTLTTTAAVDFGGLTSANLGGISGSQNLVLENGSLAPLTLSVGDNDASTTHSGIISGTGSLTKNGTGTTSLTGTNSYSGGTTVSTGTLSGNTASLQGNITNNAALVFDQASNDSYDDIISGTGTLTKSGTGMLNLSGENTFTGDTTISEGTLTLGHSNALQNSTLTTTAAVDFGSLTSANLGGLSGSQNLLLENDASDAVSLTVGNNDANTTYTGIISGTGSLTKTGAGTLTLFRTYTSPSTYSGGTVISGGTLLLTGHESGTPTTTLGSGPILVTNGATLDNTQPYSTINQEITIQGAGSSMQNQFGSSSLLEIGNRGIGSLNVIDGGSVTYADLTFGNDYNSQATVALSGVGSSIHAIDRLDLGTDTSSAFTPLYSSITASDNAIINTRYFTIHSTGTLSLSSGAIATATSYYRNDGIINLNTGGYLNTPLLTGINGGEILFAGGTLQIAERINYDPNFDSGFNSTYQASNFSSNLAILTDGFTNTIDTNSFNRYWNGNISGAGGLTKVGTGTLMLSGINTYTGNTVIEAGTLIFATDNTTQSYAGDISGSGNLIKAGSSTLTLTGNNSYTGTTAVDASTLVFADKGAFYNGTIDAASAAQLTTAAGATAGFGVGGSGYFSEADLSTLLSNANFDSESFIGIDTTNATAGSFILATNLTNTNSGSNDLGLHKIGSGNLTLSGNNTYSGGTVLTDGTLTLGNASALGSTSANLTLNGGILDLGTSDPTVNKAIFNGGTFTNGTLDNASAFEVQTGSLAASLGGSAGLTKTGSDAFTLSGANTYSGTTTINGGTLNFANRAAYYGGTLDAATAQQLYVGSGATASFGVGDSGYFTTGDLDTVIANSALLSGAQIGVDTTNATGGTFIWENASTGTLGLVKNGTGTLSLSGTSSGSGDLIVNAGTLQFTGNSASLPYASLSHEGTVDFNQSNEVTLAVTESGTGAMLISGGGTVTTTGSFLKGTGALNITNGTLNTTTGTKTISRDVTVTGTDSTLALGTSGVRLIDGSLLVSNGGTVNYDSTGSSVFSSLVIGYSGQESSLTVTGENSSLSTSSALHVGRFKSGMLNVMNGGAFTSTNTGVSTIGTSSYDASGVVTLSGTGSQLNLAGSLIVGDNGTGTLNISSGATLTSPSIIIGSGSGSGSTGTLNLLYGGNIIVGDATGTAISTGSGNSTFNFAGGTLKSNGTDNLTVTSDAILAEGTTSTFDTNGQTGTFSGALSGSGSLTKAGTGTLNLNAANTYTGTTTVSGGTLAIGNANALQGSTLSTTAGIDFGSFTQANFGGISGSQNLLLENGSSAALALTVGGNDGDTEHSGIISGDGSLTKTGTGTLTLSGVNTYTGGTTVSAGTLTIASDANLGAASGALAVSSGATLDAGINFQTNRAVTLEGSGTQLTTNNGELVIGSTGTGSLALTNGATASAFNLTLGLNGGTGTVDIASSSALAVNNSTFLSGTSTLNLSTGGTLATAALSGSGTFNFAGGTLRSNAAYSSSLPATLTNASTLDTNGYATTLSGILSGSGSLTKTGTGALTVSSASSFSGGTLINAGSLLLANTNGSALGSGDVTVASGGTLGGTGSFDGALFVQAGGTFAPGNSPGLVTIGSGSVLEGILNIEIAGTLRGTEHDAIDVSGDGLITLGGDLNITLIDGYTPLTSIIYTVLSAKSISGAFNTISLPEVAGFTWDTSLLGSNGSLALNQVPEPAASALLMGVLALAYANRRRRK